MTEMTLATLEAAPTRLARITGGLLLVMAVAAMFAELGVRSTLVVPGDARATAERILASPQLFRLGFVGYLVAFVCDVPVAVLFYVILRSVNRTNAMVAMAFRLVYASVVGACLLCYFGAMRLLSGAFLSTFETNQLHSLALFCLNMFNDGFTLALVFFGAHLVLLGWLLFQSRQVPRVVGVLASLGGLAYLVGGFLFFLAPAFHARVAPVVGMLAMSEVLLALWLLVKGVRPRIPAEQGG